MIKKDDGLVIEMRCFLFIYYLDKKLAILKIISIFFLNMCMPISPRITSTFKNHFDSVKR